MTPMFSAPPEDEPPEELDPVDAPAELTLPEPPEELELPEELPHAATAAAIVNAKAVAHTARFVQIIRSLSSSRTPAIPP
jgi:hypothetical protein